MAANNTVSIRKENLKILQNKVNFFEAVAGNDTDAFGRIRDTLRKIGDMFLFGEPTPDLMYMTMKLYHENCVRLLAYEEGREKIQSSVTGNPTESSIPKPVAFMCAMIEMEGDDGTPQFYITTSEAAAVAGKRPETDDFEAKEQTLAALLRHCNITVATEGQNVDSDLRWRTFDDRTPQPAILKATAYDEVKDLMFINPAAAEEAINYDGELWAKKYNVRLINSYQYLEDRLQGRSFAPFKKYSVSDKGASIECNNGSTCTEAKLFSYVHNDLRKKFEDIKGFIVFWVGKELPPKHHLPNYCYTPSAEVTLENTKLNELTAKCEAIFARGFPEFVARVESPEEFTKIMKLVVQPIAMACPGCYSNYDKYRSGKFDDWDRAGCYEPINARTSRRLRRNIARKAASASAAAAAKGGKRKTRKYRRA